jgi:protein tyrosine phosphatase
MHPIINNCKENINNYHQNKQILINEWKNLNSCSPIVSEFASYHNFPKATSKTNHSKNRYHNILANPDTAVPLLNNTDDDYINANFIKLYKGKKRVTQYIATQGPLQNTCIDFWRMIWEQKTKFIVMLCSLEEIDNNGFQKCFPYFPQNSEMPLNFGEFSITLVNYKSISITSSNILSTFSIKKYGEEEMLTLQHFQCKDWPDNQTPKNSMDILTIINTIYTSYKQSHDLLIPPIVVHCSAGIGRTGTFIVLYFIYESLKENYCKYENVFQVVSTARYFRAGMVQAFYQYLYIFEFINKFFLHS